MQMVLKHIVWYCKAIDVKCITLDNIANIIISYKIITGKT